MSLCKLFNPGHTPAFAPALVLLVLGGCGELPTHQEAIDTLAQAPVCCDSLAGIDFAPFPADTSEKIAINNASPAFDFDTGKSFFAAYQLPGIPVPYRITVKSYPIGLAATTATIFEPRLAVLDSDRTVLNATDPGTFRFTRLGFAEGFKLTFSTTIESMFYEGAILVDDARSRYLLIYTSSQDIEAGVPYEYMDFVQVYTGSGYWIPLPLGKRKTAIGHSAFGVLRMNIAAVDSVDLGKMDKYGAPAEADRYQGNGFSVRSPRPEGYRFADKSPGSSHQAISRLHFAAATPAGALSEAYAHSIQLEPDVDSWSGDALSYVIDNTISAQKQAFSDYDFARSELRYKGATCRRIDFSYQARNPLLMIQLPARGYDIYCVHPEFKYVLHPLIVRIGAHQGYAYGESTEDFPEELSSFYQRVEFETLKSSAE